jgi:hypothetical protein
VTTDGSSVARFARVVLGDRAVYPVVAAASDGAVVAWTASEPGGSLVRVTTLSMKN